MLYFLHELTTLNCLHILQIIICIAAANVTWESAGAGDYSTATQTGGDCINYLIGNSRTPRSAVLGLLQLHTYSGEEEQQPIQALFVEGSYH